MSVSGMHQAAVVVKEEPGWSLPAGSCGVSEAAARAGLYTDHEVKDELVVGPECLQPRDAVYALCETVHAPNSPHRDHTYASMGHAPAVLIKEEVDLVVEADCSGEELKCIKQEPSWSAGAGACGGSAAAARAGLRAAHGGEGAVVAGPESLQPRDGGYIPPMRIKEESEYAEEAGCPEQETMCYEAESVKEEPSCSSNVFACGVSAAAARAGLYAGHKVKDELVLGPEHLQRAVLPIAQHASTSVCVGRVSSPTPLGSAGQQLKLKECVVRLERMDVETRLCTDTSRSMEQDDRHGVTVELVAQPLSRIVCTDLSLGRGGQQPSPRDSEARLQHDTCRGTGQRPPALTTRADNHSIVEGIHERGTYLCDICKKRFALKSRLMEHVMVHIHTPPSVGQEGSGRGRPARVSGVGARSSPRPAPSPSTHTAPTHTTPAHNTTRGTALSGHTPAHRKKRHSCRVCRKEFQCQRNLRRHERVHTGEKPYSCGVCSKKFSWRHVLKIHERIHTGDKPYSCGVCSKKFTQQGSLKIHERIHTGEKHFSCGVCSKEFTRRYDLKIHERIHTGEKLYSCGVCSKKFTQQGSLKIHERIHSEEKPFSCGVCEKKFKQCSHLKKHERIHTGSPYVCEICTKWFTQSSHLKIHILIHTGHKPYSCDMCAKRFNQKGYLVAHIQRHARKERSAKTKAKLKV